MEAQVTIHNVVIGKNGKREKVLSIKADALPGYVTGISKECDTKFTPNRSEKYESYPLLKVVDTFDTGEEFTFQTIKDFPTDSIVNSKGREVLIILHEGAKLKAGVNLFASAKEKHAAKPPKDGSGKDKAK